MKGIILAGGSGSRLYPITRSVNKQLLPIFNKPMIYYPLTTLMLGGIRDILVITNPSDLGAFQNLLGDGTHWGIRLQYATQDKPGGLPEAFIYGAEFIGDSDCTLILGDNVFFGNGLSDAMRFGIARNPGVTAFGYRVNDPENFGVVEFNEQGEVIRLEEKPVKPRSHYAVTGLYMCDNGVVEMARHLKPSARGELEIIDILRGYLDQKRLKINKFGRGIAWLDTGNPHGLLQAAQFVESVETRQGVMIACPEEIAYRQGYIDATQLVKLASTMAKTTYDNYLIQIANESNPLPIN